MKTFRFSLVLLVASLVVAPVSWAACLPDLQITSVNWNPDCSVEFEVCNLGCADATGFVFFNVSPLSNPLWGSGPQTGWNGGIPGLAAGDCVTESWGSIQVIGNYMQVNLDPQNIIPESNETNNLQVVPVPANCVAPCK